ncbi:hypothetical protein SAMN02745163_00938 [Clostridium cavendishii DSM 21758]|uniref:Uncharacterized protein n=1 Tax=Clostridium cavendishii DSM 21758 TaxID=1121302 RepID=A0A1M6ET31_9CLOT|nr:hypothetical protein [Clostridium cavendishii]SHI88664.1 hypothetical protein SAMN02745163_00938 [Clostridium cavendishii DSM 21758]
MKSAEIIKFLTENELSEVEEVKYKSKLLVVKFYYDFDQAEIEAAKAYANEESDYDVDSKEWIAEYVIPYLNDLAIDNVGEIVEEAMENFEVEGQFVAFDIDLNNYTYNEFLVVFGSEDQAIDLDEVMDDLNL